MSEGKESLSLLLVGSDIEEMKLVKKKLSERDEFYAIIDYAFDTQEAIQKIRKRPYDAALIDSEIESANGFQILQEAKRLKVHMPFILLTSVLDDEVVRLAIKNGVAETIIKGDAQYRDLADKLRACHKRYHGELQQERQQILKDNKQSSILKANLKHKDDLTGLYTHTYLHERVVREFSRAIRYKYPISCILIDIDHFKKINEERGHRVGDELLKKAAELIFDSCRLSDLIARYGGEEFAVVLPHIDYQGALNLARRLRIVFLEHPFVVNDQEINLTVSVGVSSFPEDPIRKRGDILRFAEQSLYYSKAMGRNRVSVYRDLSPTFTDLMPDIKISEKEIVEFHRRMSDISNKSREAYIQASKALLSALESKDRYTAGHGANVSKYAVQVAETMGLTKDESETVRNAALLHDIGKICIPDEILLKPGRLTFSEFEMMKQHPYFGYQILHPIRFLREEAKMVLHHHEWYNGEGYPGHLKKNDIPLGSRIIAVIDSFDTMRSAGGRYKQTVSTQEAVRELISYSGIQFDPLVVKAFVEVLLERGEIKKGEYNAQRLEDVIHSSQLRS